MSDNKISLNSFFSNSGTNALFLSLFFTAFDFSFGFFRNAPHPQSLSEILSTLLLGFIVYFVISFIIEVLFLFIFIRFRGNKIDADICPLGALVAGFILLWNLAVLNWLYYYFFYVKITPRFYQILTLLFTSSIVLVLLGILLFKTVNNGRFVWMKERRVVCFSAVIPLMIHTTVLTLISSGRHFVFESLTSLNLLLILISLIWAVIALTAGVVSFKGAKLHFTEPSRIKGFLIILIFIIVPIVILPLSFNDNDEETDGSAYNFVLLTFDTLRADALGVYGGGLPTSAFNKFAEENIVFENSHSTAPWTIASMVSLFSSQFPSKLSVGDSKDYYTIPDDADTFAEEMDKKGYKTAAFVGNYLLRESSGILQGFDSAISLNHHTRTMNRFTLILPLLETTISYCFPKPEFNYLMDSSKYLVQNTVDFIRGNSSKKFFLWVHFIDPHDPYNPPEEFRKNDDGKRPWPVFAPMDHSLKVPQLTEMRMGKTLLDESERKYAKDLYDGEVIYMDKMLSEILDVFKEQEIYGRTVICVTSDHGEEFWEHGKYYHGQSLYEELVKVPLIISIPGIDSAKRIKETVSSIDVIPTFFDIAGLKIPDNFDGRSLMPYIKGEKEIAVKSVFCEETYYYEEKKAVIKDNLKLIVEINSGNAELYDLSANPGETEDISSENPDIVEKLKKELFDWIKANSDSNKGSAESEQDIKKRNDQLNQMKALGYVN